MSTYYAGSSLKCLDLRFDKSRDAIVGSHTAEALIKALPRSSVTQVIGSPPRHAALQHAAHMVKHVAGLVEQATDSVWSMPKAAYP